jgi:hypothetical protein
MKFTALPSTCGTSRSSGFATTATTALLISLALLFLAASAQAQHLVYVVTFQQQFGTVDLTTGAFHQIGPLTPEGQANLVWGPHRNLLSITFSGNLESINPRTGVTRVIGATGLGYNTFELAEVDGRLYATDLSNNLYRVNATTGAATLVRPSGIPPDPSVPFTNNPDGTINLCDEALYGFAGQLYATFDAFTLDPNSLAITPVIGAELYRIDPMTGEATPVAPTAMNLGSSFALDGKFYGFKWVTTAVTDAGPQMISELMRVDLETGDTTFLKTMDAAASGILGAAPVRLNRW